MRDFCEWLTDEHPILAFLCATLCLSVVGGFYLVALAVATMGFWPPLAFGVIGPFAVSIFLYKRRGR